MLFIYSEIKIDGLVGNYGSPRFFDKVNSQATEVRTDDATITKAYKDAGVKVEPLTVKPKAKRKPKPTEE